MTEDAAMKILAQHIDAENRQNLEDTLATLHPECVFIDHATGQKWFSHAGARAHYLNHWQAFDVTVERADGQVALMNPPDLYVAQAVWRGTHIGEFMGISPARRKFEHAFTVFVRFRDGLMLSEEFFYDLASLMEKLGGDGIPALGKLPFRDSA